MTDASMIDARALQRALVAKNFAVTVDGEIGPQTQRAMARAVWNVVGERCENWLPPRMRAAFEQIVLRDAGFDPGPIDGLAGDRTRAALAKWRAREEGAAAPAPVRSPPPPISDHRQLWPLQSQCDAFYGNPRGSDGRASAWWETVNLTSVKPPFVMTYAGQPIKGVRLHKKCADSFARVLGAIWEAAEHDQRTVDAWGASIYGGAYNFRLMRGSSRLSMHAWGCAIDLDPARNGFHDQTGHFLEAPKVIAAFEAEGWIWGGRWAGRGCDPMHFQAARVA